MRVGGTALRYGTAVAATGYDPRDAAYGSGGGSNLYRAERGSAEGYGQAPELRRNPGSAFGARLDDVVRR